MRKLWMKAWMTLDGVCDADTKDHGWLAAGEEAVEYARQLAYVMEEEA